MTDIDVTPTPRAGAEMSDDDPIRRGDVLAELQLGDTMMKLQARVRAIPAAPLDALTLDRAALVVENDAGEFDHPSTHYTFGRLARAIRALAPEPAHVTAARVLLAYAEANGLFTADDVPAITKAALRAIVEVRHD